ncbi:Oxa1Ec [Metamycoplasma arthritidis]|uniref:Preprotein translocase subunit YidC n=1 Tax=Metamycoplasma arthritidis (strain 158L3-1) TaxID=243272 RepID=B3PNJ5_META1|nr:membrane protein insertase YidC [Metamycoplasma arthritidis]ACF07597.1 preprotein translocase subunit YidC [Metamycoplasma arthritidis 158L3-1]VEU79105.1 Oxa1Ec [Metamycoplasma arthritidis]
MASEKSKHYDSFKVKNNLNNNDRHSRQIFLKVWKWVKIILIIIFVSIGLVGCVQSFTGRSGIKVGSGQELYTTSKRISPNIETLRYNPITNSFTRVNSDVNNVTANTYLGLKDPSVVEKLRKQDEETGATYGSYGSKTLGLQLQKNTKNANGEYENITQGNDGGYLYSKDDRYAYYNLGNGKENTATKVYKPLTKFEQVLMPAPVFHTKKQANGKVDVLYNRLKAYDDAKVLNYLPAGADPREVYLRDIFQILTNETLKYWEEHQNDPKLKWYKEFKDLIASENGTTFLEKATAYFNKLKTKVSANENEDKGLTTSEGNIVANFARSYRAAIGSYLQLTKHILGSRVENGTQIYSITHINNLGNYSKDSLLSSLFDANSSTPQKALATAKDYWGLGPFYGLFVQPVNLFMNAIITGLGTTGWSVILALVVTVIIVRLIAFAVSFKATFSQSRMEEFNQKKAKIEAKYAEYKSDKQMQQRKQLEIAELYKKEKISPWSGLISSFITLPILIVVFRIISASPEIKQATWYSIQLSTSSIRRVIAGDLIYLPIIIFSVGIQALAQYMPKILNRKKKSLRANAYQQAALKKENKKFNIISLIFIGIGVIFSAGLQIYWIIGGIWTILQHIFVHYFQKTKYFKEKVEPKLFPRTS